MKEILIVVASDPRTSPRPAEAVRVADGLSHSEELRVSLLIEGAAASAIAFSFGRAPDPEWIDGPLFQKHLLALRQRRIPLYVHSQDPPGGAGPLPLQSIDAARAAELRHAASVAIDF